MMKTETAAISKPEKPACAPCPSAYSARMRAIRTWVYENCCKGRKMKTPVPRGRDYEIRWDEPRCFGGDFYPMRAIDAKNPYSIAPSILITRLSAAPASNTREYLDSRSKVTRPQEMGYTLTLNLIHCIYEPGERAEEADADPHRAFCTEEDIDMGSLILGDWMDDTCAKLIAADALDGTGLYVKTDSILCEPLVENETVSDRRPIYLGVVQVTLMGLTREKNNASLSELLD